MLDPKASLLGEECFNSDSERSMWRKGSMLPPVSLECLFGFPLFTYPAKETVPSQVHESQERS